MILTKRNRNAPRRGQQERHRLGGAAKLEQCDTHTVQPVAREIDDHGTRGEGEHSMELARGQLRISRVEQEKAELLATYASSVRSPASSASVSAASLGPGLWRPPYKDELS
jgi:hypothetical protein